MGGVVAPIAAVGGIAAAPFTGGASLGVLVATGAATGAITSVINGGNPLTGAITGAVTAPITGGIPGAIAAAATSATFVHQQQQAKQQAKQAQAQMQANIDYYTSLAAKTRAQIALDEKRYGDATQNLNRIIFSRNKIISADRKAVLKKAFFIDRYSMDHSQQNDFDPLNRDPNNVRQRELIQEA